MSVCENVCMHKYAYNITNDSPTHTNTQGVAEVMGEEDMKKFGASYGSSCAAWEDGMCSTGTEIKAPAHSCGTSKSCDSLWSDNYNFNNNQAWCCDSWCYVNRTTCTAAKAQEYGIDVLKSWTEKEIWYSYDVCPDPYSKPTTFTYEPATTNYAQLNMSQCPYVVTAPGCECTGQNANLGADMLAKHGADYGKWCAAWEDGKCNETATGTSGVHTCDGTNASSCEAHWPDYNFGNESQTWCCDSWCYVSPATCTAEVQEMYGVDVEQSWTKTDVFFSYAACADEYTAVKSYAMASKGVADNSQFKPAQCPYTISPGAVTRPVLGLALLAAFFALIQ